MVKKSCQVADAVSMCQAFLGALVIPVFLALYFCTLIRLPRDVHRLLSCDLMFGSKKREPNIKSQADYLKLLASFPIAEE